MFIPLAMDDDTDWNMMSIAPDLLALSRDTFSGRDLLVRIAIGG